MLNKIIQCDYLELFSHIENESIDVLITDPPFGIDYQNNYTHQKHKKIIGDDQKFSYIDLGREAYRVLKPNSAIFCFTCWSEYPHHFYELKENGFELKEPIICQKRPSGTHDLFGTFQSNADWCMFAHKGNFKFKHTKLLKNKRAGTIPNKGRKPVPEFKRRLPSCWFGPQFPRSTVNPSFQKTQNLRHPTIKSTKFVQWLIEISTNEGDIVLDPFIGTGTVAVASLSLGRNFIACDIDEECCEMSRNRINNINEATNENGKNS